MAKAITVTSNRIDEYWKEVVPFIEKALLAGDPDVGTEHIHQDLLEMKRQLWLVLDKEDKIQAVIVTQINNYPRNKVGQITLGAGNDMYEWIHYIEVLFLWFKDMDCTRIEIQGRPGWVKKMEKYGFKTESVSVRKVI